MDFRIKEVNYTANSINVKRMFYSSNLISINPSCPSELMYSFPTQDVKALHRNSPSDLPEPTGLI